jgi:hypothetical protein
MGEMMVKTTAFQNKHLLVLAGNTLNGALIDAALRQLGFHQVHLCLTAASTNEIMASIAHVECIDVVLAHISDMADGPILAMIRQLRAVPLLAGVPIIGLRESSQASMVAQTASFDGMFAMPLGAETFANQLGAFLSGHSAWGIG